MNFIQRATAVLIADAKRTDDPGPPRCFGDFNAPQVKDYNCCTDRHCTAARGDPICKTNEKKNGFGL